MKLPVIVLPRATRAMADAIDYYEKVRPGHGALFRLEIERTIDIIARWPDAYELATSQLRRAPIGRFADTVVYCSFPSFIRIVNIVSARRDPAVVALLDPS